MEEKKISPRGEVCYAHLKKPEVIVKKDGTTVETGKFSITILMSDEDRKAFHQEIETLWEEFQKTLPEGTEFGLKNTPLGSVDSPAGMMFRFRKNESFKDKNGDIVHMVVPVFDSNNCDVTGRIASFGKGSVVRVSYEPSPFYTNSTSYGVSLRLLAVQVLKYVPFVPERNAEKYGFTPVEGGFNSEFGSEVVADEDIPF